MLKAVSKRKHKVHSSIYADDFIITGASKEVLETKVKPLVEAFLHERGLELSQEKTKITHIDDGFDFLSINVRKYKGKCITKPSKKSVKLFLANIREIIKTNPTAKPENLIHLLNPKIRGWAKYFRFSCAKRTFSYVDHCIHMILWSWVRRRHTRKGAPWLKKKYFRSQGLKDWIFSARTLKKGDDITYVDEKMPQKIPGLGALLPVLDHKQACDSKIFIQAIENEQNTQAITFIPINPQFALQVGVNAFALKMKDESMEPELMANDILFIDPDSEPRLMALS